MRAIGKLVLLSGIVLVLAGPSVAQDKDKKKGNRGGFGGAAMLIANEGVQKELKLTDEQIEKAKTAAKDVLSKFRDDFAKLKDATPEQRAEIRQKMTDEVYKSLDFLKPEQMTRLKQIALQQAGPSDPAAQKTLKLTDEQKEKLKKVDEEAAQKRRDLGRGGDREKMTALRKETQEKQLGVLSDEQKKQWKEMTGEPFEVKFQFRARPKSDT